VKRKNILIGNCGKLSENKGINSSGMEKNERCWTFISNNNLLKEFFNSLGKMVVFNSSRIEKFSN